MRRHAIQGHTRLEAGDEEASGMQQQPATPHVAKVWTNESRGTLDEPVAFLERGRPSP